MLAAPQERRGLDPRAGVASAMAEIARHDLFGTFMTIHSDACVTSLPADARTSTHDRRGAGTSHRLGLATVVRP